MLFSKFLLQFVIYIYLLAQFTYRDCNVILVHVQVTQDNEVTYCEEDDYQIAADECNKDTKITPPVIEADAQRLIELISDRVGTVIAATSCIQITDVTN